MGTEVQSKMYLPGDYSLRDLNENTSNGGWSLRQQNNIFSRYHDFLLTRQAIDVNEGHEREQLRQTILRHESMFRQQLHELHRLYRIQKDMMNEMRSKELNRHMIPAGTLQFSLHSSGILVADDNGRQYSSNSSLDHGRLPMAGADSIQCQFRSMKESVLHSSCGPNQNGLRLKNCETLESGCKKLQRRLFDLEVPANEYIDDEEDGRGVSEVSTVEGYFLTRSHEVTRDRDRNLSIQTGADSGCNGDVLSSYLHTRKHPQGLSNWNEPIKVMEASASASASNDVLGNIVSSKEEMVRRFLSSNSNSGFQCLDKFSQNPERRREQGIRLGNLHLETEKLQKGWLPYKIDAGQTGRNECSFSASFGTQCFPATSKSRQTEPRNSSEHVKKKIFGVEICERNHGASVEDSRLLTQCPLVPQSNVANSESSFISSWKKLHSGFNQDMTMIQGNPSFNSFTHSNKSSMTLMKSPELIEDKSLVDSNSRSIPSIFAEASSQNHLCLSSQLESKESRLCFSSNGFACPNGISDSSYASGQLARNGPRNNHRDLGSMMGAKSAEEKKVGAVAPKRYQNEAISQNVMVSVNGTSKQSRDGELSWLKVAPSCNGNSSEERQVYSQMNLDSLQNSCQQFVDKTEMMRKSSLQSSVQDSSSATCALDSDPWKTEVGECSSNRKILGFSISEKPPICKDLPSPSTLTKPSNDAPAVYDTKAHDAMSPKFGQQHKTEDRIEKGLVNHSADSRCHIDLNLSVVDEGVEEVAQPTFSPPRTSLKIPVEIDLEAPLVVETDLDIPPGFESFQNKVKEAVDLRQDEYGEPHEGLTSAAAEALVSISSSCMPLQMDIYSHQSGDSSKDPLDWFAEVISSYNGDIENELGSVSMGQDSVHPEVILPDAMDYFEYMTLNLTETMVEQCCYKPQVFENAKTEISLLKRPRRGQARRGRQQRKDFQRDVLPTLTSLLRNEVTEDLQTIEGLIQATGGTWKSTLSLKTTTRNGGARRKRRLAESDSPENATEASLPQTQLPNCREVVLEDRSLLGWGKRTRRPPRQRCPNTTTNPPLAIK